jgi:hypothetical protein
VKLVQVDPLEAQASKAVFALPADRLGSEIVLDHALAAALPAPAALGEDEDLLADAVRLECAADHLFGVAEPVHRRRVDPVHAFLDRVPDGGDRLVVVDLAPPEPPRPSDRPGAESDGRQPGAIRAEGSRLHYRERPSSSR